MITITRNIPSAILATAIFFALSSVAASAQTAKPAQQGNPNSIDQNSDGKISLAEAQWASAKNIAEIDTNKDGVITATEIKAEEERARLAEMQRRLSMLDANHDGKVTTAEFAAMDTARFKAMDKNNDGMVTPEEMRAAQGQTQGQ